MKLFADEPLVILAAGRGVRFQSLTNTRPKPMIKVAGLNSIERDILNCQDFVSEVVIVVGFKEEVIKDYRGY